MVYVLWFSFVEVCWAFPHLILSMLYSLNIDYRRNSLMEYTQADVHHRSHHHLAPNKLLYRPKGRSSMDLDHPKKSFLFFRSKQFDIGLCSITCKTIDGYTSIVCFFLPVISKPNAFCVDKGKRCFRRRIRCIRDAT